MTVTVRFLGPVLRPDGVTGKEVRVELSPEATVSRLLETMGYRGSHVRALGVFREDGRRLPLTEPLVDAETVTLMVPFGGG